MRVSNTLEWDKDKHTWFHQLQNDEQSGWLPIVCEHCKHPSFLKEPEDLLPKGSIYCPYCKKELIYNEHEWW